MKVLRAQVEEAKGDVALALDAEVSVRFAHLLNMSRSPPLIY